MTRVLVTGGSGFIGFHLTAALLGETSISSVTVIDSFTDYYSTCLKRSNLRLLQSRAKGKLVILDGDIKSSIEFLKTRLCLGGDDPPNVIFHLAAQPGVNSSVKDPVKSFDDINSVIVLLEFVREYTNRCVGGITIFIASSSSVYGSNTTRPFDESSACVEQSSPYAASKRCMEIISLTYVRVYKLQVHLMRFFTVYGPHGRPDMSVLRFVHLIHNQNPITINGNPTKIWRDYTYIDDVIRCILNLFRTDAATRPDICNIGGGRTYSLQTLIELIEKKLGKRASVNFEPSIIADVLVTEAGTTLCKKHCGVIPETSLSDGVEKTIQWYLSLSDEQKISFFGA